MNNFFQKTNVQILPLDENMRKEFKIHTNDKVKINKNKKMSIDKNKLSKLQANKEKIEAQIVYTAMMTDTLLLEEEE